METKPILVINIPNSEFSYYQPRINETIQYIKNKNISNDYYVFINENNFISSISFEIPSIKELKKRKYNNKTLTNVITKYNKINNMEAKPILVLRIPTDTYKQNIEMYSKQLTHLSMQLKEYYLLPLTENTVEKVELQLLSVKDINEIEYQELKEMIEKTLEIKK